MNAPSASFDGKSFVGLPSRFEVVLDEREGVWWQLSTGERIPIGNAKLRACQSSGFWLTLEAKNQRGGIERLRCPEHLMGYLFAHTMSHLCIVPHTGNIPSDGSAGNFHRTIPRTHRGTPVIWGVREPVEVSSGSRYIHFRPHQADTLSFKVRVAFKNYGHCTLRGELNNFDLDEIMFARPWGRGPLRQMIARGFRAEHKYIWLDKHDDAETKRRKLQEIARHRLLDLMGALEHVRPPGGKLVGHVSTQFAGHREDVLLLKEILKVGLIRSL